MKLIYLGRSRLHRDRANLIQTLHTAAAFQTLVDVELWLPPWHRHTDSRERIHSLGVAQPPPVISRQFLHRRWPNRWFPRLYRRPLERADQVYTRSPPLSEALGQAGIRHSLEIHDSAALSADTLQRIAAWHARGLIQLLVPISTAAAAVLENAGCDPRRVHTAPSGVALDQFKAVHPLSVSRMIRPRAGYVGRISIDRGLRVLEALADAGVEVQLTGVTENAPTARSILHLSPPVAHGAVPDLYDRFEIALLPYQPDLQHAASISPMKLFEAMAAGRPVIASDLPALRALIREGENGLLVDPTDAGAWIAAIKELSTNPQRALAMSRANRRLAKNYSWEARARGILSALHDAVPGGTAASASDWRASATAAAANTVQNSRQS